MPDADNFVIGELRKNLIRFLNEILGGLWVAGISAKTLCGSQDGGT